MLVCLDAGHGKETAGKRAFDESFFEYEFNRDVTARIKALLEARGVQVILTAPTDADVSLSRRCAIANQAGADIVVSIHANAFGTTWNDARGWVIYHNTGSKKGEQLAEAIWRESIPYLGLRDRGIADANFTILADTIAPAVLVEHGFYTNRTELAMLKTNDFRERCAVADTKGILRYLGVPWSDIDYQDQCRIAHDKLARIKAIMEE